jgi:hypothetical protein
VVGLTDSLRIDAVIEAGQPLVSLLDPDGQTVNFASLPAGAGSTYTDEFGQHFYLGNPTPGMWTVRVTAQAEPCQATISIAESSPVGFSGVVSMDAIAANDRATILGQFTGAVSSPFITADIVNPAGSVIESLTLFDDGLHGDAAAADGLFGAQTQVLTQPGRFAVLPQASQLRSDATRKPRSTLCLQCRLLLGRSPTADSTPTPTQS